MDLIEVEKMISEATVKLEAENARLREELAAAQLDAERYIKALRYLKEYKLLVNGHAYAILDNAMKEVGNE